jgi:hypothetical protein
MTATQIDFKYSQESFYPKLFLGAVHKFPYCSKCGGAEETRIYNMPGAELIAHQSGGLACNQLYLQGFFFDINSEYSEFIKKLDKLYYESNAGCFGGLLFEIINYQKLIKEINADCDSCYELFEESVYPLDLSVDLIKNMIIDDKQILKNINNETDLDNLIVFKDNFEKFCGCIGWWNSLLITENSD